ncbi:stage V sporulation protein S [Halanaerobacter jeridensis]|uniref:Stage V sporulation protein S n=1 Tax=Halanaerobacter jeridensis TaxID=706427 RepID=A0A939BSW7_9FIRM|nr:stage V sporulation protein S [Halanaerobacter jeridensis]MBM7557586.1 stage V sporulation protein S [Halanaerobacter jeridensis]
MEILKVATDSNPKSVAEALVNTLEEEEYAELQAIGAGAVNQGVKAVAIARDKIETEEINLTCIPAFMDVEIDGDERTAIKLIVEVTEEC